VLASGERICQFCNSHSQENQSARSPALRVEATLPLDDRNTVEWRGELDQRMLAYRAKRRRGAANEGQSSLPFDEQAPPTGFAADVAVQVQEPSETPISTRPEDFSFTIAIGRPPRRREPEEDRVLIDVSMPPETAETPNIAEPVISAESKLFPAASLRERRMAALIDGACLAFAYGGFLTLFGSLGGHFTLSKLSAAICFFTFAFVYLQYFGLFTIFGGTTPGMMIRGLQLTSFSGAIPTPRQLMLRAAGYMISAGTLFMGFMWALWDEDGLTWHDRLSRTYLAEPEPLAETEAHAATH
jgi:uncharacterized RDD family membrane protein YckC